MVARLSGGPLATTGVIQGMSGSPVYIDDRLLGAVSYSLGSFSKDAIAGNHADRRDDCGGLATDQPRTTCAAAVASVGFGA